MLFVRWKKAFRNRYAGTDCKTPIGAVVKSYGIERMGKGGMKPSVASHEAERKWRADEASLMLTGAVETGELCGRRDKSP